jgi:predicted amidophosphoribosyltransferase
MLVPVPLHRSRHRQRGYNQAEILAELLGRHWGWPVRSDLLVRTRATDQQAKLDDPRDRARNLRGAFRSVCGPGPGEPDTIFLVDDLITSGATVLAASGALASKGWVVAAGLAVGLARQDD